MRMLVLGAGLQGSACAFARAMLEAQGLDGEDSVWSDSPLQPAADGAVFAFGVTDSGRHLFPFIAHTAADHGLHVFDMQAAALYRPDRHVIFRDGVVVLDVAR